MKNQKVATPVLYPLRNHTTAAVARLTSIFAVMIGRNNLKKRKMKMKALNNLLVM